MSRISVVAVAKLALALLCMHAAPTQAAEIRVLAGSFLKPAMDEIGPQFERTTGHKLVTKWVPGPAVLREVEGGQPFDVAVSQSETIDQLIKGGKIEPTTRTDVVRVGLAIAVRAGTPKPDVASVEAFKRTLLTAKSIGLSPESVSSRHLAGLLERFEIVGEVKPKLITPPINTGGAFGLVARGETEIGLAAATIVPGTELVGFPSELQLYEIFVAAVSNAAKEPEAAKALVRFLASEAAGQAFKAKGMEPANAPHTGGGVR